MSEYPAWGKTERLEKIHMRVTEKIDGTNGLIDIRPVGHSEPPDGLLTTVGDVELRAGSRNRWLEPSGKADNYGFAAWVLANAEELVKLGTGRHYGEWWGQGIGRNYGLRERRFSLFNTHRPAETLPSCVYQVPLLYSGQLQLAMVDACMEELRTGGSKAAPYPNPEGVVVWLGRTQYKHTFEPGPKGAK